MLTVFESSNEVDMKNYLLKPHKRISISKGKYWVVKCPANASEEDKQTIFDDLWMFILDKHFICIHFSFSPDTLVQTWNPKSEDFEK